MSRTSRKSLSPESLVSALIPHISQQTSLLPTLHQQLGLPPSALEADLSALREALLKTVEDCVENRRKEITDWAARCESVESRCKRLETALGRRTGSIGEVKKQNIYPLRHQQLFAQEEKLQQLYTSKLEQLNALTTRLSNLALTLGPTFFSDDILNPTPSPGELSGTTKPSRTIDDADSSIEEEAMLRDVTPERFNRIEKELVRGKNEINRRLVSLSALFEQIAWLYTELGIPLPLPGDPTPSSQELPYPRAFRSSTNPRQLALIGPGFAAAGRQDPFVVTPAPDPERQRREYFPLFAMFVSKLQEAEEGLEVGSIKGVDPTLVLVEWFEHLKTDLEEEKSRREAHIQTLYDQLEILWKRLGISDADIDDFVELNRGSTAENVRAYELELERMLEMKRERMGVFIGNARAEIERLWDDLMWSEEEREVFAAFHDDVHSEDLLTIHEEEIARLKEERRSKAPILVSIRKYFQICDEQKQLEASASDQSRLTGRGARGDPGRLLREEKMRKRVLKEKPKLEQELLVSVPYWEGEVGKPLLVNGIHFMGLLEEAVRVDEARADSKKRPRTNSTVGRAITPAPGTNSNNRKVSSALSVTPSLRSASGSSHASTAFSMSTTSSTSSVPGPASKRQKLNNAQPHAFRATPTNAISSTVVGNSAPGRSIKSVPMRPPSRQGTSKIPGGAGTPSSIGMGTGAGAGKVRMPLTAATLANLSSPAAQALPSGGPGRAPSRAGGSRAPSPSKLSTVSTIPTPTARPVPGSSNQVKGLLFPTGLSMLSVATKNGANVIEKADSNTGRAKRRESFKPRPSSPGLGREYAEMWRGKTMLRDEALSEDSEVD